MTNEERAKALEEEATTCGRPYKAADLRHLAAELRAMPPDTRPKCREWVGLGTCGQPALENGMCAAHVADGVL